MPKDYIMRLVFDCQHLSLIALKDGKVIGGITFRPFSKEGMTKFIEVVFCVITKPEQRGGYGSRLMNHLKAWCQKNSFYHLLTYADDTAIGYFQRQGFSMEIKMDRKEWDIGFLKYYDSATLMHAPVDLDLDYLAITHILHIQRAKLIKKMTELTNQHVIHPPVRFEPGQVRLNLEKVPGLKDCGWDPVHYNKLHSKEHFESITNENRNLLETIKRDTVLSEPFSEPVIEIYPEIKERYCQIIKDPIDLRTITERLDRGYYLTPEMMISDLHRMLENCKTYMKAWYSDMKQKNPEKNGLYESADLINERYLTKKKNELGLILNSQHN
eukprot:TRINITY_DN12386_c0_g1_i27.p1 TRINITY_DN12386_c0_g1~~TRINITY_DN12386_c0_g1_i27.p1  ORF type:complete len:327 (-),score=55.56 TRINITY_DN12386_c0_g1_i27:2-982(-)